ncbi:MAG: hypothetical protein HOP33_08960 [Verrucomicrobia bacterium]|nr:hypothetical protein [Verrucomicrobiota bacterium]
MGAESENSLDILINILTQQTGDETAQKILEKLRAEIKKLQGELDELKRKSEDAHDKGGKGAKKHAEHIDGLHRATNLLFRQFGELGHLLHSFVSLPALGLTALGIGIAFLTEKFHKMQEKIEETAKKLETLNASKLDALRTNMAGAVATMQQLNDQLDHAGDVTDPIKGKFINDPRKERMARYGVRDSLDEEAKRAAQAAADIGNDEELRQATAKLAEARLEEAKIIKEGDLTRLPEYVKRFGEGDESVAGKIAHGVEASLALGKNRDEQSEYQSTIDRFGGRKTKLNSAAARALAAATGNYARIGELDATIGAEDKAAVRSRSGSLLDEAEGIAARLKGGGHATPEEQGLLRTVASASSGSSVTIKQAIQMLTQDQARRRIYDERLISVLEKTGGLTIGLDARLKNLEMRIQQTERR